MYTRITHTYIEYYYEPGITNKSMLPQAYSHKPQATDARDYVYTPTNAKLRDIVDLRAYCSPVEHQYHIGSCTGNALANTYETMLKIYNAKNYFTVSRLFIYYNIRLLEGTVDIDTGGYIRDGIKAMAKYGVCDEECWPYNIEEFATPPAQKCYDQAKTHSLKNYQRLTTVNDMMEVLNENKPFAFGIAIYSDFPDMDSDNTIIQPRKNNEPSLGGHAMCMVGYDLTRQLFLAKNSFGPDWADRGYCWIPFDYMRSEGYDSWCFDLSDHVTE